MFNVSIVKVSEGVEEAVSKAVDLLGGLGKFVKRNDKVAVKVNMFIGAGVETGKITDPRVVIALSKLLKDIGADVTVVERLDRIYKDFEPFPEIHHYAKVVSLDELDHSHGTIPGAESLLIPVVKVKLIEECDVFINVPGLRTHALTLISNGMKNLMGILPGGTPAYVHHCGLEGSIVDLNAWRHSDLIVTDAIYSLQGNFPSEGHANKTDLVMASDNVVAMDSVAAKVIGFEPGDVNHLVEAHSRGLGPIDLDEINILGMELKDVLSTVEFEKAASSYDQFRDKIIFIDRGACVGCKRGLAGGVTAASHKPEFANLPPLTIITGHLESEPEISTENVILYGNCAYKYRHLGTYVHGCNPLSGQAANAILSFCKPT